MKSNIGGKLQGISLDAFLQMAQMEQITCTLSVTSGNRKGELFLQNGNLISAEANGLPPLEAAHHIISWEKTIIDITESCSKTADEIKQPLMNILMEAMRLRDDAASDPDAPAMEAGETTPPEETAPEESSAEPEKAPDAPDTPEKKPEPAPEAPKPAKKAPTYTPITDTPKRLPKKYIAMGLALVVAGVGLVFYFLSAEKRSRLAFDTLVQSVETTEGTIEKLELLNVYIRDNKDGEYTPEAKRMIEGLMPKITALEFETIKQTAARRASGGDLEGALAVYQNYLKKDGTEKYRNEASRAVEDLSAQIEAADFEKMHRVTMALGPERIFTYQAFLEKHPDGSHREEVLGLIAEMEEEYFAFLQRQTQGNETPESLVETIELGRQFIDTYPGSIRIEAVNRILDSCRSKFLATQSFEQLQARAKAFGTDHESSLMVYKNYLNVYPGSPVREKIEKEIDRLTGLAEEVRLSEAASRTAEALTESGTRFKIENNETALDKRTGLMWCLLDSRTVADKCQTYEKAAAYVAGLETGGHDDWRLPTPKELSILYQKSPTFPSDPDVWYWSSETEKRYIGQWVIEVAVFQPGLPDDEGLMEKESWQCGSVRAVRRP
jgi:hypothetical protein